MNPPFISLCIPTFQRAAKLAATLEHAARVVAAAGWEERVEFCVSDNASTDETPEVIAKFTPAGVTVRRFRQQTNVGFARNLRTVSQMATGEYLMFVGDDDALEYGVFANLEKTLAERPAVALFPSLPDQPLDGNWDARREPRWLQDGRDVSVVLGFFHLTFLGNFVVRRSDYLAHDEEKFCNSLYPHTGVLLRILQRERARWSPEALFEFDAAAKTWNQSLLTATDLARIYTEEWLLPQRDAWLAQRVYPRMVRSVPRAFLNRKLGRPDEPANPYRSLRLSPLLECYRADARFQALAAIYWMAGKCLPTVLLQRLLGPKPLKVEFPNYRGAGSS